jgi:hypothetical protein
MNFLFAYHEDDPTKSRQVMYHIGGNVTGEVPTLGYRIADSGEGPRVEWEQEPLAITANQAMLEDSIVERENPVEARECDEWLKDALSSGPQSVKALISQGKDVGFSEHKLNRAKERLEALSKRHGFGKKGNWEWYLPSVPHALIDRAAPP